MNATVLCKLMQAAMPAGKRTPAPDAQTAERAAAFLERAPREAQRFLKTVLHAVEFGAIATHGSRMSKLPQEKAEAYVQSWAHSGSAAKRLAFRALISPLKIVHFGDAHVARALGYDPPRETACAHPQPTTLQRPQRAEGHLRTEVAVIGSGAGGATVAKELAERGRDVVLLEEGAWHGRESFTRRPVEMSALLYRDLGMTMALGRAGIPVPLGKTVGGTTTINSGTCIRVPERVLDHWRDDLRITRAELDPLYERVEAFIEVEPVQRHVLGKSAELVIRGAERLGLHPHPLRRNARHCRGSGVCVFGCPTDAKRSANVTWVPAALRHGARLVQSTHVDRIDFGKPHRIHAGELQLEADAVVVACGTLHSPGVLHRSGVRHPQLGRNVSIHPACKANALFDEVVKGWEGVPQGLGIDDLHEQGVLFEGIFTPPEFGAFALPFVGRELLQVMEVYERLAAFGFLIEDRSMGTVSLGRENPVLWYDLGAPELEKLRLGVETLARIFFAAGAREVFLPIAGFSRITSEAALAGLREKRLTPPMFELSAFHPLGSCRASRDPARGVVDDQLELHDAERVFVVDGSIFPSSLSVNPQLTIMAFAQRAAAHIDARLAGMPRA